MCVCVKLTEQHRSRQSSPAKDWVERAKAKSARAVVRAVSVGSGGDGGGDRDRKGGGGDRKGAGGEVGGGMGKGR